LQLQQIIKATRRETKAIVVEPFSSDQISRIARHAQQARLALVFLNSASEELRTLRSDDPAVPIVAVASDQVEIGRLQGRQVLALLPTGGHVLYVQGPSSSSASVERSAGLHEVLDGANVHTTVLDGHWSEATAFNAVKSWLRLKLWETTPVDLVVAQDDSMARGARRAVESAELGERWSRVEYLGIDGVPDVGQKMVDTGQLAATIVMPSNTGPAIESLHRWATDGARLPSRLLLPTRSYPDEVKLSLRRAKSNVPAPAKPHQLPPIH
jgi:ABC-type sugar transport system substrate-binding protein